MPFNLTWCSAMCGGQHVRSGPFRRAEALRTAMAQAALVRHLQAVATSLSSGAAVLDPDEVAASPSRPATQMFAPAECRQHLTALEPIRRGGPPPPPENVNRLRVLTDPGGCGACTVLVPQLLTVLEASGP